MVDAVSICLAVSAVSTAVVIAAVVYCVRRPNFSVPQSEMYQTVFVDDEEEYLGEFIDAEYD